MNVTIILSDNKSIVYISIYYIIFVREEALKNNIYNKFIKKILDLPLWIKQILYLQLTKDMQNNFCERFLKNDNIFITYSPILTYKGQNELKDRICGFDSNLYNFLQNCLDGCCLAEISAKTFLSLEEIAKIFEFCLEQEYIEKPKSNELCAITGYLSGKLRLGEYLLQIGILTEQQLKDAVEQSKNQNEQKFGEILIDKNYVKPEDLKAILILKSESKKRFILDCKNLPDTDFEYADAGNKFQNEISELQDENKKLKNKMNNLLELVKQHDSF